ncbi:MAG: DUF3488 and transglutaminase-like domain-containing protein [Gammaproteobacteria bacterium]
MSFARLADPNLTSDRLSWLLVSLVLVLAPHVVRLPLWVTALFVALAIWRLGAARVGWKMPPAWLRAALALGGFAAIGLQFREWGGQEAGIAMLVVMVSLKLTETTRKRDGVVLVLIGYILVIGNFLYSQTLPTGAYMLFAVWVITATLLHLNHPTGGVPLAPRLRQSGVLLAQALPVALVLFLLFPRVPGPLWGVPTGQDATGGLTDRMEPGSIAELSQSDVVAFRVEFDGAIPPRGQLYWRGPVLRQFDGRAWTQGLDLLAEGFTYESRGAPVAYEVSLEPHRYRWLFALDLPAMVPDEARLTRAFQLYDAEPVRERKRYAMESHLDYTTGAETSPYEMRYALQLPRGGNPQARALAARLRDEYADPRDRVNAILLYFRTEPFFYTLSPPLLGQHSVDEFLFGTRRGFCEHYAGAFAFVMRAAGVPTRVVLGYQGGELNPVGDYLIVRQSDAHAWTEVHFDDVGWVRVDPTAAVSPDRIEFGASGMAELEGRARGALGELAWVNRLRLQWDDLNNRWNQFVLGYNRDRQRELLEEFGFRDVGYRTLVVLLVVSLALVMGALGLWLFWQARPARVRDPAVRLYLKLQRLLERRGVLPRRPDEGPRDYAARASAANPALATAVGAFIDAFVQYRYHPAPSAAELAAMKQALASLKN